MGHEDDRSNPYRPDGWHPGDPGSEPTQAWYPAPAPHGQGLRAYAAPPPQPVVVVPAKTGGLAVLFSFLWLGAGHLYAGRTVAGVVYLFTNLVLWLLTFIPFAAFVTVPIWFVLFVVAAATSHAACTAHNRRLGLRR